MHLIQIVHYKVKLTYTNYMQTIAIVVLITITTLRKAQGLKRCDRNKKNMKRIVLMQIV